MDNQVIVSDITISKAQIVRLATQIHYGRQSKELPAKPVEVLAEALCLALVDYLEDILTSSSPLPEKLESLIISHEGYFERWGI